MITASMGIFTHFLVTHNVGQLFNVSSRVVWLAGMIAFFSTVLPSFMMNAALRRSSAQAVSVIGGLGPVATIVMAIFILGEPFTLIDALGTVLVMSGVGLFTLFDARRARV
jgi:drug/metabolite transporter (DMT)-like permease